ncbi:MAG TPA: hypothetical protein VH061_07785 [Solirubrobacteraceae bacterium]|jgi:hypothetical protein|nr:hypothetical protein [Solirubrobacteraceae bacterium]
MRARNEYLIAQVIPAPPGWCAVFAENCSDEASGVQDWIEIRKRPLVALALVKEIVVEGFKTPSDDELAEGDMQVHGLVCQYGGWFALPQEAEGDFLGYAEPRQMLERFLSEVDNPKDLPIAISSPADDLQQERRWAETRRAEHNVIPSPRAQVGEADG